MDLASMFRPAMRILRNYRARENASLIPISVKRMLCSWTLTAELLLSKRAQFERFSVYGFSIKYPDVCWFEFNPKSRREKGDIVVHFPEREKIFVSWGELKSALQNYPTEKEQSEQSIRQMSKSRNVGKVDRITNASLIINSHPAEYNRVGFEELSVGPLFTKTRGTKRVAYSVHLHCPQSSRYFVIHLIVGVPEDFEELFRLMAMSFECH
jgi:hypothetical protein